MFLQLHNRSGVADVESTVALCCFIMLEMFFIQQQLKQCETVCVTLCDTHCRKLAVYNAASQDRNHDKNLNPHPVIHFFKK